MFGLVSRHVYLRCSCNGYPMSLGIGSSKAIELATRFDVNTTTENKIIR